MPNAVCWTYDEDENLCIAYTNTSESGATSTDQASDLFWARVHAAYQLLAGSEATTRKVGALQTRWSGLIRPDVSLYASALASAQAERRSGWTEEDYKTEAENRFTAKREQLNTNTLQAFSEGKSKSKRKPRARSEVFCLHHCYEILKESVRFMRGVPAPRKRQRLSESVQDEASEERNNDDEGSGYQNTSQIEDSEDLFDSADVLMSPAPATISAGLERPKSAGKKKSKQLQFEDQVDRAIMHSQRELAKATCAQVNIMKEQLEVSKKKVSIMELQHQASKDQAEMTVMSTSTQGLSDLGKEYLLIKQRQYLEKLRGECGSDSQLE